MALFKLSEDEVELCSRVYSRAPDVSLTDVEALIKLDISDYTAWVVRRELLAKGSINEEELGYVRRAIDLDHKSYQAWYHRRWVLALLLSQSTAGSLSMDPHVQYESSGAVQYGTTVLELLDDELKDLDKVLEEDEKNHNVWQYRQWLVSPFISELLKDELAWTTKYIEEDFRNNSVWNYRLWLIHKESNKAMQRHMTENEFSFATTYLKLSPNDEAIINHLEALLPWYMTPKSSDWILSYEDLPIDSLTSPMKSHNQICTGSLCDIFMGRGEQRSSVKVAKRNFVTMIMWVWLLLLAGYGSILLWISIKHNIRTTCRQVFIFHPWCDAGGGGEKCLWLVIKQFAERAARDMESSITYQSSAGRMRYKKPIRITLLCHATTPHIQDLLNDVDRNFGIKIPTTYVGSDSWQQKSRNTTRLSEFVTLRLVRLHTASLAVKVYPFATQFLQLAAGFIVAFEAAIKTRGNRYDSIWDTTGLATTIAWYNGLTTMMRRRAYAYVHYPFLRPTTTQQPTWIRKLYNKVNAFNYAVAGACYKQPIIVNSTYTERGLMELWPKRKVRKVLPPVTAPDDAVFQEGVWRGPAVISIAQFRKEKRQYYQIEIIAELLKRQRIPKGTKFFICGSCRPKSSSQDDHLVLDLLRCADRLCGDKARIDLHCHSKLDRIKWAPTHFLPSAQYTIEFHINLATKQLRQLMINSNVGLHTMIDEHLGISVAEMTLYELYVVAHNSAGPRDDILRAPTKEEWCAITEEEYEPNFLLGALCNEFEEFVNAVEYGLEENMQCQRVRNFARRMVASRFPSPEQYGKELLNNWNLYVKRA